MLLGVFHRILEDLVFSLATDYMLASRGRIYFGTFNDLSHEAPPLDLSKQFHSDKSPTSLFCALMLAYARRNYRDEVDSLSTQ
jgi:hypothetical protein